MDRGAIRQAWTAIEEAAERHEFGGAVTLIVHRGEVVLHEATGWAVREPEDERVPMERDTIFDLASLTKVVATTPVVLRLAADGTIGLDDPIGRYIPEYSTTGPQADMTIRRLLAHTSGMTAWRGVFTEGIGAAAYTASLAADQPYREPGSQVEYSCMGFITLADLVNRVTGRSLDDLAQEWVFAPLGMTDTMFTPPAKFRNRIAATEEGNIHEQGMDARMPVEGGWRHYMLRGEVHDGNAWYGFRGISGNAGLFGTARDLARYGQMWLNGGQLDGARILPEEIVREAIREQSGLGAPNDRRGLGWQMVPHPDDTTSPNHSGRGLSERAFGHTGFTGTSLWIDPDRDVVIVLLTNRVHPKVNMAYLPTRRAFTEAIGRAVT